MTESQIAKIKILQQPIIDKMVDFLDNPSKQTTINTIIPMMVSAPTGIGKSYIIPQTIKNKKNNRKSIIVVPTNQLVFESKKICDDYGMKTDVVIGYNNYISSVKLKEAIASQILFDYIEETELKKYTDKYDITQNGLFYDIFEEIVQYKNGTEESEIIKTLICSENSKNNHQNFNENISITNIWYLLYMIQSSSKDKFNISEYDIIIDEVHQLDSIANKVNEKSFSIFHFNSLLHQLKKYPAYASNNNSKLFSDVMSKTIYKKALSEIEKLSRHIKINHTNLQCANELITDKYSPNKVVASFKKSLYRLHTLINKHKLSSILEQNIAQVKLFNPIEITLIKSLLNNIKEVEYLMTIYERDQRKKEPSNFDYIKYSPVKGVPILIASLNSGKFFLSNKLWRVSNKIIGLSATLSYSLYLDSSKQNFDNNAFNYIYTRLGIITLSELKNNITNCEHFIQPRIFDKKKIEIFLPNKQLTDKDNSEVSVDNIYDSNFDIDKSKYYTDRITSIHNGQKLTNYTRNAMVLCGGYTEAYILSERYKELYPNEQVIVSEKRISTSETVTKFIKMGEEKPTILFATRNFGTGISLIEDTLVNLYILRLPYTDIDQFRWVTADGGQISWTKYNNEMIMSFIQNLGRLPRTLDDYGTIFILDKRYYNKNLFKKLNTVTNDIGVIITQHLDISDNILPTNIKVNLNDIGDIKSVNKITTSQPTFKGILINDILDDF